MKTPTKIQPSNGGKTHVANPYFMAEHDGELFPMCRTGGQDTQGTFYRKVTEETPVTCKTCQRYVN